MDKMKARCWYESIMPLIPLPTGIREDYESKVAGMVRAAHEVAGNLRRSVKKAWFKRPGDVKGDTGFIDSRFWQDTEGEFYAGLEHLRAALEKNEEDALAEAMRSWHMTLCRASQALFDSLAWEGPVEHADPKRVVLARRDLERLNKNKKITVDLLGLHAAERCVR
jgi:CRISPR system Cascade subunit CasA